MRVRACVCVCLRVEGGACVRACVCVWGGGVCVVGACVCVCVAGGGGVEAQMISSASYTIVTFLHLLQAHKRLKRMLFIRTKTCMYTKKDREPVLALAVGLLSFSHSFPLAPCRLVLREEKSALDTPTTYFPFC